MVPDHFNTDLTIGEYLKIMKAFTNYSRAIDDRNWDQLDHAFSEDALWISANGAETRGREAIKASLRQANDLLPYRYLHTVANVDLEFVCDTVHSTSNWSYFMRRKPEDGATYKTEVWGAWELGSVGVYHDRLQKIDGEWLFSYRRIDNWEFSEPSAG